MTTPEDLGLEGAKYWRVVSKQWKLDDHQWELLRQACMCLDTIEGAEADVASKGALVVDRFGQWKQNPSLVTIRDMRGLFSRLVRELGLAAVSEMRPPALPGRGR